MTIDRASEQQAYPAAILFGPPGSGKGTQAKLMTEWFPGPHVSTGDLLRAHIAARDPIGLEVQAVMAAGKLVSDELVNQIVEKKLDALGGRGIILDGYPRTVAQAQVLLPAIERHGLRPIVLYLVVDNEQIVARLSGRRQCPDCKTLYSLTTNPPRVPGVCDLDGTVLLAREDDEESVVRARLQEYAAQTAPLLRFFQECGVLLLELTGSEQTPEQINRALQLSMQDAGLIGQSRTAS